MTSVRRLDDLFVDELRIALAVEEESGPLLTAFLLDVHDRQLENGLRRHRGESEEHAKNVASSLRIMGAEPLPGSCPALDGLRREHDAFRRALDPRASAELRDLVLAGSGARIEGYELALYESLVAKAGLLGQQDLVTLLEWNRESERAMLDEGLVIGERLARGAADARAVPAR